MNCSNFLLFGVDKVAVVKHISKHIFILFLVLSFEVSATTISGRVMCAVTDEDIIGATIVIKEQPTKGSISGLDGSFLITNISNYPATVIISFIGYGSQEVVVENATPILVKLHENALALNEVVVTGGAQSGRTDNSARAIEKNSINVVNVMSAKAIEISPDMTVANVIQRMSGVTMERNSSGDGQYALLRGMDKRFNYTLVNGIKIPSPDNKNRFVPLDIFPSELLDRLEVTKALTADMESDGIGGAVNLVMKDAPSQLQVNANVSTGFNTQFFSRDYQEFDYKVIARQSPINRYGDGFPFNMSHFTTENLRVTEKELPPISFAGGFSVGGRTLNDALGIIVAASYSDTYRGSTSDVYEIPSLDEAQPIIHRYYSTEQKRTGLHAKLDFHFNENHKLMWYNAYMNFQNIQVRDAIEKDKQTYRMRWNRQSIMSSSIKGTHDFLNKKLLFNWSFAYGNAFNETPDNATVHLRIGQDGTVWADQITVARRRWEENSDNDKAVYTNLTYISNIGAIKTEWQAGAMYRDKQRDSRYQEYSFKAEPSQQFRDTDWKYLDEITMVPYPSASLTDPLNYDASEKIGAGYAQIKGTIARFQITVGARIEHTIQGYDLKFALQGVENKGEQNYYDILPVFHAKYELNQTSNLRLSYVKAINRPSFLEIVPYAKIFEDYNERGNPDIKHTVADNIDFRYELFPKPSEQFMAGIFYKYIKNPIEYGMIAMGQESYYMPLNFGDAYNTGMEIDMTKYFRRFGIKTNYTFTHSRITTLKWLLIDNPDPDAEERRIITEVSQTRQLFGQAAHVSNFSLLFKDIEKGWDAQIALSYTDKRVAYISRYIDQDTWLAGNLRLDMSAEKHFSKIKLTLFTKISNLLDTPMYQYVHPNSTDDLIENIARKNGGRLDRKEYYGQNILVGVKYKL